MQRRRRTCPTDLKDAQWPAIAELVPQARPGGRPRRAASRELINAILYALRGGQAWRLLPHGFPPWQTVHNDLRRWQAEGVWQRIHHAVLTAGGYAGKLAAWAKPKANLTLSIVKRPRALPRFEPLPGRSVIERTFGWVIKNRRLVRDFGQRTDVAQTLIRIAATATMLRRVAWPGILLKRALRIG